MIPSPNTVTIDLSALVHNLRQVKKLIAPETRIMGIVKSDAYGHGLVRISRVLEENGVDCLGVAHPYEALELRKMGVRIPIVLLCGIKTREEARAVIEYGLTPVLFDLSAARILDEEWAVNKGRKVKAQLKIDTGMGRLGLPLEGGRPAMERLKRFEGIEIEALMSHLSSADDPNIDFTDRQIKRFQRAIDMGREMGMGLALNNLANSAGILAHRSSHFDMVRPGIMLYGGLSSPGFQSPVPLLPVMGFRGRVLQIRDFPGHTPVSYGRSYYTTGHRKVAVLSAGYGDGLPRRISNKGEVLVGNRRAKIVGRVCMNMIMVDVTGMEDVDSGQEVFFLGGRGDQVITGDDMARWAEAISYEIFCSIGPKHIREYINEKKVTPSS